MEIKGVAEKLVSYAMKKYQENKTSEEAEILWIICNAFSKSCNLEYQSYNIIYSFEDYELHEGIEHILFELDIKSLFSVNKKENIDKLVQRIREDKLITVINKAGSEEKYDLDCFYNMFKNNLNKNIIQLTKKNEQAMNDVIINGLSDTSDTLDEIKSLIRENKSEVESNLDIDKITYKKILVRNFYNGTESIMQKSDFCLDLVKLFDDRYCKEDSWEVVIEKIEDFCNTLDLSESYELYLSVCYSIAYYLGIFFNSKSGVRIRLMQSSNGLIDWTPNEKITDEYPRLTIKEIDVNSEVNDIAICISITCDISEDVKSYLENSMISVKKILNFSFGEDASNLSVKDGNHAWKLATQIKNKLDTRTIKEKNSDIHIFISAPVALVFFLGQMSFSLKNINLYEFTGVLEEDKIYKKSIFIKKGENV